jgi:hypothetical protein
MRPRARTLLALAAVLLVAAAGAAVLVRGEPTPIEEPSADVVSYGSAEELRSFLIGVWVQPNYSFATWRSRGIDTIVGRETLSNTVPFERWREDLRRAGLRAIREPEGDLRADSRDPSLRAWMHGDEPDLPDNDIPPERLQATYERWKQASPQTPVLVNLSGAEFMKRGRSDDRYAAWTAAADWVSNDLYPVTGFGRPDWIDASRGEDEAIGSVLDALNRLTEHKPLIQIVEASDQRLLPDGESRSVTPGELRGSVWHAVIHGARGIVYFPQQIGGEFKFDVMTEPVAAEMQRTNRWLRRLSPLLLGDARRVEVPAPFEVATRRANGREIRIVLNFSAKPAQFEGREFAPYEVVVSEGDRTVAELGVTNVALGG